eukprot:m.7306 g.7306  ORF g.7306 m.7306 type:complete len:180 (-) comp3685_c0_seq1:30-569(-)
MQLLWRAFVAIPVSVVFADKVGTLKKVSGRSMQPTLNPTATADIRSSQDWVYCDKLFLHSFLDSDGNIDFSWCGNLKRGDLVVFTPPHDPTVSSIKRVIGLPGDCIETPRYKRSYVIIPPGKCWLESDNKENGKDSNSFGLVPLGLVNARAVSVVWPLSRWCHLRPTANNDKGLIDIRR